MKHEALTGKMIAVFYDVYNELGHGFLESVYETAMRLALAEAGLVVSPKRPLEVWFRGQVIGIFEPDIIVDEAVSVELKAGRSIDSAHEAQLLNYLRASTIEVGLLFNFGRNPEFKRLVFDNDRKHRALTGGHNRDGGATSAP